jgi:hypothetical protein
LTKNYFWILVVLVAIIIISLIPDEDPYYDIDPIDTSSEQVADELSQTDINTLRGESWVGQTQANGLFTPLELRRN